MTREEIEQTIERLENANFSISMKDYLSRSDYEAMERNDKKIAELKAELEKLG